MDTTTRTCDCCKTKIGHGERHLTLSYPMTVEQRTRLFADPALKEECERMMASRIPSFLQQQPVSLDMAPAEVGLHVCGACIDAFAAPIHEAAFETALYILRHRVDRRERAKFQDA